LSFCRLSVLFIVTFCIHLVALRVSWLLASCRFFNFRTGARLD
jgi:hypothetical protein